MGQAPVDLSRKRFLQTMTFVVLALILYGIFPQESRLDATVQSLALGVVVFLVLPFCYVRFVLREPFSVIGFRATHRRFVGFVIPMVVLPLLTFWFLLIRVYPEAGSGALPISVRSSFLLFVLYEVVLVGVIAFLYDVFFRGIVQLLWLSRFGAWAAILQVGLFTVFAAVVGRGLSWRDVPLILAAIASGSVAAYSRSVPLAWTASWLVLFLSDVIILIVR